nr:sigma-54-dependent Fis family transcriptional regulator [Polyangiaceae bacterium]
MPSLEKKPPGASAPSPGADAIDLVLVFSGGEVLELPRRYRLSPDGLLVGREAPEGVSLSNDPRASRRHATLRADAGGARVRDEGSSNGTFVNGARADDVALTDGDVVAIGDSLFVVSVEPANVGDADLPDLVGTSPAVRRLRAELARAAPNASVVLLGERGGDQEAAARALHALSGRTGPFVTFDCGALPEGLAESQLFGHAEGAFAGATALPGLFRTAEGGTLFLDELGQLPPALQPKLLRALQDRTVWPAGATLPQPYDVRIIAATDRAPRAPSTAAVVATAAAATHAAAATSP